jgi:hypothetical protein
MHSIFIPSREDSPPTRGSTSSLRIRIQRENRGAYEELESVTETNGQFPFPKKKKITKMQNQNLNQNQPDPKNNNNNNNKKYK